MFRRLGHRVVAVGGALLLSTGAFAQDLSYDHVELRYVNAELDGGGGADADGDGFNLNGSMALSENVHVFAGYETLDFDFDIDLTSFEIGAGWNQPIANGTDIVGRISYIDGEVDTNFGDADDSGFGLSGGLRHVFTSQFQGGAFINYTDLDDSGDNTSLELFGEYFFTPEFTGGLTLEFDDDATVFGVGGRWYFGGFDRR